MLKKHLVKSWYTKTTKTVPWFPKTKRTGTEVAHILGHSSVQELPLLKWSKRHYR